MRDERLHDAIFHRRSVRRYDMAPLPQEVLDGVLAFARAAKPLDPSIRTAFVLRGAHHVVDPLAGRAPHYLALYSETRGAYRPNAGYLLQQVDLHLSASGLGACWLGLARPNGGNPEEEKRDGLSFVVMLAFGTPAQPLHRSGPEEFSRLPIGTIADLPSLAAAGIPDATDLLEAVRLAPSATNSQPWRFAGAGAGSRTMHAGRERLGPFKEPFMGRMNAIDVGIGLCHLALAAGHRGLDVAIDAEKSDAPAGMLGMARVSFG